jgi:DNA-directed RNA polymerase specialized sigma24 family protein
LLRDYVDMGLTQLHLVDRNGQDLADATRDAVNDAYRWAVVEFPNLDQAAVAGWAEDLGKAMAAHPGHIEFPRRYATSALKGKILGWFRKHPGKEIAVGVGSELEQWAGLDPKAQIAMERTVLFEQLRTKLNERDRQILMLLLQDITSPRDVAEALGISYAAAAKAIQRVKERIAAILLTSPKTDSAGGPPHLCKTEN